MHKLFVFCFRERKKSGYLVLSSVTDSVLFAFNHSVANLNILRPYIVSCCRLAAENIFSRINIKANKKTVLRFELKKSGSFRKKASEAVDDDIL
jgi:hypothetical protein